MFTLFSSLVYMYSSTAIICQTHLHKQGEQSFLFVPQLLGMDQADIREEQQPSHTEVTM